MLKIKKNYRNEIIFFVLMTLICFAVFNLGHRKILAATNGQVNLEAWSLTEKKASNGSSTTNNNDVVEATLNYNSSVESDFKDIVIPNAADFQSNYPVLQKVWIDSDAMALVANNANKEGGSLRISDTGDIEIFAKGGDWSRIFQSKRFITSISLSGLDTSNVTDMCAMFCGCISLSSVDLSGLDTSNVTDMMDMFYGCISLSSVDLSGLDTSNVTDMCAMFSTCRSLSSVDLSGLDTSNVIDMSLMFSYCSSLHLVDLSGLDTSNVTDMSLMFCGCSSLRSINLSGLDLSNVIYMGHMFSNCISLSSVDLSGLDMSNVIDIEEIFDGYSNFPPIEISNNHNYARSTIEKSRGSFGGGSSSSSMNQNLISKSNSTDTKTQAPTKSKIPETLQTRKYLFGYSDGTMKPENCVTNAEFATVMYRLMNNGEKTNYDKLGDIGVEKSDWFAEALAYLIDNSRKIIKVTDEKFNPNKNITGYEMLNIIHSVLKFYGADKDLTVDQDLNSNVTRTGMVKIIFDAFERKSNLSAKKYSDLDNNHWAYKFLMDASE